MGKIKRRVIVERVWFSDENKTIRAFSNCRGKHGLKYYYSFIIRSYQRNVDIVGIFVTNKHNEWDGLIQLETKPIWEKQISRHKKADYPKILVLTIGTQSLNGSPLSLTSFISNFFLLILRDKKLGIILLTLSEPTCNPLLTPDIFTFTIDAESRCSSSPL